ncbi:hypothetical protein H9650_11520 [Psychrobacillus sp. Sa2BUA9]|uniref:Uncharacterized protein n=1 Tax=Psychrobacillus faecigallinarum TaxID=2762235 RepID=A0ABR8RAC1_9BACI|nr:hypothetical protein [Psychrobacillus faecigallinarum]MBD7944745.1 hypothetical protein [Psychrobacillus faecigallinarum]
MKPELFRQQDYHAALRVHASILDCSKAIEDCVKMGDLEEAISFVRDINNSLETLKKLADRKVLESQMKGLLDDLVAAGVNVMVVKRNVQ